MRTSGTLTLAAVVAAGFAAACADLPTGADRATAASRPLANPTPLAVSVSCTVYSFDYVVCTAHATGGSGTGYSFTWGNAYEQYEYGAWSEAWTSCYWDGMYMMNSGVTVTDSNGSIAQGVSNGICGW